MKQRLLSVWVVLAAGFLPLFAQQAPVIVFESETKDLGRSPEGQDLRQVFKFTNKGQGQLEILNVQPG